MQLTIGVWISAKFSLKMHKKRLSTRLKPDLLGVGIRKVQIRKDTGEQGRERDKRIKERTGGEEGEKGGRVREGKGRENLASWSFLQVGACTWTHARRPARTQRHRTKSIMGGGIQITRHAASRTLEVNPLKFPGIRTDAPRTPAPRTYAPPPDKRPLGQTPP